ncbi:MAG: DNA repair protein RecN [Rhodobacteraceae bacterium]|nr:DNA repair protein RecN [Paracoccaceae bacterium]
MLRRLSIRNIVLIEALDLEFGPGLNALTGETGAGKSILLDSLGLALGARGGSGLTRLGAPQGSAAAVFEVHPQSRVAVRLAAHGFELMDGNEVILRRTITEDGRSKAFINDQPASVAALREVGEAAVEIHGQHDDRGLLDSAEHRAALDVFAGNTPQVVEIRAARETWREAADALEARRAAVAQAVRDQGYLNHAADEIEAAAPEAGEEDRLDAERRLMKRAERLAEDVSAASETLSGGMVESALMDAARRLQHAAPQAEGVLDATLAAVDRALAELGEAGLRIQEAAQALVVDPARLEQVEERLFALRALARKHNCAVDALPGLAAEFRARLADIDAGSEALVALERAAEQAETEYMRRAEALHKSRAAAAGRLDAAVVAELAPLKMERARFVTEVGRLDTPGPEGVTKVEFTVSTNPGAQAGPIVKIASGGELSRFLLALKVALTQRAVDQDLPGGVVRRGDAPTLIFDEIDRGVGGATADAVGARLRRLAHADVTPPDTGAGGQVLVVTHSPQVAARADSHWRIEKSVEAASGGEERAVTHVIPLDEEGRIDEIARMISGEVVSLAARVTAKTLIDSAADGAPPSAVVAGRPKKTVA